METPNKWWKAVLDRDREFDGRFVYAVRSTAIYCRPTCPSRRPSRGQVLFFPGCEPAEQAGFRACPRCYPRDRVRIQSNIVREVCRYIEANSFEAVNLSTLSSQFRVSVSHLRRVFLEVTPATYCKGARHERILYTTAACSLGRILVAATQL
jgi:AraC family transcriptional regulator of adaptative response/methylated-DNA-[protein]-cysteine methyltransferase